MPKTLPEPETLVTRGQALAHDVRVLQAAAIEIADGLGATLAPLLPEGVRPEDTFVPAIREALDQDVQPVGVNGLQDPMRLLQANSVDDTNVVLEDIWYTSRNQAEFGLRLMQLMEAVESSLQPFSDPDHESQALQDRQAQVLVVISGCDVLREAALEIASDAARRLIRLRWESTAMVIGDSRLQELWLGLARGDLRLSSIAREEDFTETQPEVFAAFLDDVTSRIGQELFATRRERQRKANPEDLQVDDVEAAPGAFCVKWRGPDPVRLGEAFEFNLVIRNDHMVPLTLDSIDVESSFLRGFEIVSIDPAPVQQRQDSDDYGFSYDLSVAPADAVVVTFVLRPVKTGNFSGEICVWTDDIEGANALPNIDVIGDVQ